MQTKIVDYNITIFQLNWGKTPWKGSIMDKDFLDWAVAQLEREPSEVKSGILWALKFEPHTVEHMLDLRFSTLADAFFVETRRSIPRSIGQSKEMIRTFRMHFAADLAAIELGFPHEETPQ